MKLSRERKLYVVILGLASAAFGADRLMGGEVSEPTPPVDSLIRPEPSAARAKSTAATALVSLDQRLREASEVHAPGAMRDGFAAPQEWQLAPRAAPTTAQAGMPEELRLTAVMSKGAVSYAFISGKWYRAGDVIETARGSFRVIEARDRAVVIEHNGEQRELHVADRRPTSR